ncbi:hypothetical protein EVAR_85323_1 [Eumeta japonica]|uniref:Uncharacterized protein n=1 Tax=Eumeta variegata TaxID=151549 RepID=A0A4C2A3Q8_EUMVA|nr:hypothetical protein EVAR_85323_1 [Eumeta japonica]
MMVWIAELPIKKTEQSIALNNENVSMPESVTSALHAVTNNENETVIYSDELGIGLGPMLSGCMNHRERWLRNYQLQFGFVNHQVASSFSRERSIRGGSLILIRNNLKFKERTDIVGFSVERVIEIACVELEQLVAHPHEIADSHSHQGVRSVKNNQQMRRQPR